MQKLISITKKYSRATRQFTFLLEMEEADELVKVAPVDLFNNEDLKSQLTQEQREQVAFTAGYQHIQTTAIQFNRLKNSQLAPKKASTNTKIKRNKLPKNI